MSQELIDKVLALDENLRYANMEPCQSIYCQIPQAEEDNDELEDDIDQKVDDAFHDYLERNNIQLSDERAGIMVEMHDDENGICDAYTNLSNFLQFFNLM